MTRVTQRRPQGNRKLPPRDQECDLSKVSRKEELFCLEPWGEVNRHLGRIWICRDGFAKGLHLGESD